MAIHEEKLELMKEYADEIFPYMPFYMQDEIPTKCLNNALKTFATGLDKSSILGFWDTTLSENGKEGFIFADDKFVYKECFEKPHTIWYDEIESMEVIDADTSVNAIDFKFDNSPSIRIRQPSNAMNTTKLCEFIEAIIYLDNEGDYDDDYNEDDYDDVDDDYNSNYRGLPKGIYTAGYLAGIYGQVNKSYDEEKFHAQQGHGFAAERANNLIDQLKGKNARVIGDDNAKNGADRIVDGVYIQSKYCQTASQSINACFENGSYRYMQNGKPMQVEVPKDQYSEAVKLMENKIRNGQVYGVNDPVEAKNIVREGNVTYKQALNIAKAGNIDSLVYDAANGAIIAFSGFGVSALITFAVSIWNGEDFETSIKAAASAGLKVFGTVFATSVVSSQLLKAGLNSALVGSSEAIVSVMGPKASALLVNAFRSGSNIYGAAAMKSAAKLLRGNFVTGAITVGVLSVVDIANLFNGRISGKQLFKNLANTTATVAGGGGGWLGGAAIGSAILPGVGTVVGGLIGAFAGGSLASKASDAVLGTFIEDDAEEMIRIIEKVFSDLASEYLINNKEADKIVSKLQDKLDGKKLKDMFESSDRKKFARNLLTPIIEDVVSNRKKIIAPTVQDMTNGLKEILEGISDNTAYAT